MLPIANKTKKLSMNGSGEFLANPSCIHFLEELRPVHKDFQILFETNGVLFDEAHWERFAHLGDYHMEVIVTINSLRQNVYRYLSGGFDYLERVLKNLRFMRQLRQKGKIDKLKVTMVVQDSNFWEVPEYIQTFAHSQEYMVDEIVMKPLYKWFHMERETYWFKNMLNPLHPYHKAYLHMLEDDCWKEPKVYDWGCHNLREAMLHPLSQEKIFNRLLIDIYENDQGLTPVAYMKTCLERIGVRRIGVYGENDFTDTLLRLLREAGAEVVFQLSRYEDADGEVPTISMPNFRPDSVEAILLLEFYDMQNRINNLRSLKFEGPILTLEDLIEGEVK